jgi:anaerobic selenocysteine-containing dehydrogenase
VSVPCLGRTETDVQASGQQFVTTENSMAVVQASRGFLPPASDELLSEPAIVAGLATATLGQRSNVKWQEMIADYDRIRDHIERVVPGFDDYNNRVRHPGGFHLPTPVSERVFKTLTGRARFTVHDLPKHDLQPDQLLMMTIRSHDQFNTSIYSLDDRYRGISGGRRVVFLNQDDMALLRLTKGQIVDLVSHFEGEERVARNFVVVPYNIPRHCAATYFPETNVLVPVRSVAEKSNTPVSKSVVISIRPSVEERVK